MDCQLKTDVNPRRLLSHLRNRWFAKNVTERAVDFGRFLPA